ncbi:MAG TPA: hypothetical protein VFF82_07895 [Rhodocyclaceae bacterium]|nr:hypothetical protein [Rhodocyclaceae bacterium]
MCIKAGKTEMSSVKALMTMSLNAVFANVFGLESGEIAPGLLVFSDLHMTADQQSEFSDLVSEYFDGLQLEFTSTTTVGDIFNRVIEQQFVDIPAEVF